MLAYDEGDAMVPIQASLSSLSQTVRVLQVQTAPCEALCKFRHRALGQAIEGLYFG